MDLEKQKKTPFLTAMKEYVESNPVPFDVPGHKMGRVLTDLADILGENIFKYDINAPIGVDNLYKNTGVIKEAQDLLADAFNADESIFLINGTTSGIMMMIMGCVKAKEKIIIPRNVHKSVINALIVSGAIPVFVEPVYDQYLGIANGVNVSSYIEVMEANKDAKAIFVINPTYFGIASSLKEIVEEAHKRNMIVLCDEAHGAHFHFHENLPLSAMDAGADVSAVSLHKTAGSLTQSSALLIKGNRVDKAKILKVYTMFGSTSPSHILLASIDAARKLMALKGRDILNDNLKLAKYARNELNKIPGIHCLDENYINNEFNHEFSFDETRLVIIVRGLGKSGFDIYKLLKKRYNIQVELAETYLVLAILAIGSKKEDVDKLISAFKEISYLFYEEGKKIKVREFHFDYADIAVRPRVAYHAPHKIIKFKDALNMISSESIMIYPPGIPLVIPGEIITQNIIDIYDFYENGGSTLMQDSPIGYVSVIDEEEREKEEYKDEF